MAHNEDCLPWKEMASLFQPAFVRLNAAKISENASNFTTPFNSRRDLMADENAKHFVAALELSLKTDATSLRLSLPKDVIPAHFHEIIIDDATATLIAPTMQRHVHPIASKRSCFREKHDLSKSHFDEQQYSSKPCYHDPATECDCILPFKAKMPSNFDFPYHHYSSLWHNQVPGTVAFACNIFGSLLTNLQPFPIMRLLASLHAWPRELLQCFHDLFQTCLTPYLTLNLLYSRPETWRPKSKQKPWHDYRDTALYQEMVGRCTKPSCKLEPGPNSALYHPHRDFFDIPDVNWMVMPWIRKSTSKVPQRASRPDHNDNTTIHVEYGKLPFSSFISSSSQYSRRQVGNDDRDADIAAVRHCLTQKRLPPEIANVIVGMSNNVDFAYNFNVLDDPLHPENVKLLKMYLDHCWQMMVVCYVAMGKMRRVKKSWNAALDSTLELFLTNPHPTLGEVD